MSRSRNYLWRIEPYLHHLERDEIIVLIIMWGEFNYWKRLQRIPISIYDTCTRAKITRDRYEEILAHFIRLGLATHESRDKLKSTDYIHPCFPLKHRTNVKMKSELVISKT